MSVNVSAADALDGVRLKIFTQQQRLHFALFKRSKHAAQPGDSTSMAARLLEDLPHQFTPAIALPLIHNLFGAGTNLIARDVARVGGETPQQRAARVRMQLRLDLRTVNVQTTEDPFIEETFLKGLLQHVGDCLEMLADFVVDPALRMATIVAGIAVAASLAGKTLKQTFAFGQFAKPEIKNASLVTIDKDNADPRKRSQHVSQRLEMEMAVHEHLRARQGWGQFIFVPYILSGTGEYRLGVGAVAAQVARKADDAVHIGADAILLSFALTTFALDAA
jgi:hypothetical protein